MALSMKLTLVSFAAAVAVAEPHQVVAVTMRDGLKSIGQELMVLMVFLATWTLTRHLMQKKSAPVIDKAKVAAGKKKRQDPQEVAATILVLCQDQYTRGLRLYRDLVRQDLDREITGEAFYTSLVEASVRVGKPDVAVQVLLRLKAIDVEPSTDLVQSVLKLFAARRLYAECIQVWAMLDLPPHQVIYSCVTVAACETGDTKLARKLLAEARARFDVSSREWLALMRHHVHRKDWRTAVSDLSSLTDMQIPVDNIVFNTVLGACSSCGEEALPKMYQLLDDMHDYEAKHPAEAATVDVVSYNTLLKALARSGSVEQCFSLLEKCTARGVQPDDVSFSTLLDVCIDEGEHDLASVALERMSAAGLQMNCIVMTTLMKGFIRSQRLDKAMQLYDSMRAANSQVKPDMITHSMLIKANCDAHDMSTALKVLEDMLESDCTVDDVVFTHLIEGCCQVSNVRLAEKLFADMRHAKIKPSVYTLNGLVKVYGKCGKSDLAVHLVETMEEEFGIKPSVVIVTCLCSGLCRNKQHKEAWRVFDKMRLPPDAQSTATMLAGLADGQMWPELLQLAQEGVQARLQCLRPRPRQDSRRPGSLPDAMNYGLAAMLSRSKVSLARDLFKVMVENDITVTVQNAAGRLGL